MRVRTSSNASYKKPVYCYVGMTFIQHRVTFTHRMLFVGAPESELENEFLSFVPTLDSRVAHWMVADPPAARLPIRGLRSVRLPVKLTRCSSLRRESKKCYGPIRTSVLRERQCEGHRKATFTRKISPGNKDFKVRGQTK